MILLEKLQLHYALATLARTTTRVKLSLFAIVWMSITLCLTRVSLGSGEPLQAGAAAYQALQFFILGAPGVPTEGPSWAVWLCRALLFVAPAMSGGILLDSATQVAQNLLGRPAALLRWQRHAVVIGYGTHGTAVVGWLASKRWRIAVLDHKPRGDGGWMNIGGTLVPAVCGDLADASALAALGVQRAALVVVATRNQIANLGAAQAVRALRQASGDRHPCTLLVLVDDAETMGPLDRLLAQGADDKLVVKMLDRSALARIAAKDAADKLNTRWQVLRQSDGAAGHYRIAVVGAGRYGCALIGELARRLPEVRGTFVVVDPGGPSIDDRVNRELRGTHWSSERLPAPVGNEKAAWIPALKEHEASLLAVFLCVDDDMTNLLLATKLDEAMPQCGMHSKTPLGMMLRVVRPLRHGAEEGTAVALKDGIFAYDAQGLVRSWLQAEAAELATPGGTLPRPAEIASESLAAAAK